MDNKKISKYFTYKEALYLPKWGREANEEDGLTAIHRANLVVLFSKMDKIREFFDKPIIVHVAYRPEKYNTLIGGSKRSAHMEGKAVDFHIIGVSCDEARKKIIEANLLEDLDLRMEDIDGANWIHIDTAPVKYKRFFKP